MANVFDISLVLVYNMLILKFVTLLRLAIYKPNSRFFCVFIGSTRTRDLRFTQRILFFHKIFVQVFRQKWVGTCSAVRPRKHILTHMVYIMTIYICIYIFYFVLSKISLTIYLIYPIPIFTFVNTGHAILYSLFIYYSCAITYL